MARRPDIRPSDGELAVLRVLWDRGPSTVRQVHDALDRGDVRYTTTLKIMQNMTDKGLLRRSGGGAHVYSAGVREAPTQRKLVGDLLDKAFGGSAKRLVAAALQAGDLSEDELQDIRRLLAERGADHDVDQ